jgi:hypothetical protein
MPKDIVGNELQEGGFVQVTLDQPRVFGRIKSIQNGGLAIAGQQGITPGMILVAVEIPLLLDPRTPQVLNIVRVVDPEEKKQLLTKGDA